MSRLIIVCGLSGTGKTTLSEKLSRELHLPLYSKDVFKERLAEELGCSSLSESNRLGKAAIILQFQLTEENLRNGVGMILEGPFNHSDNPKLFTDWEKKYQLDVVTIVCSVDKETRKQRVKSRERHFCHFDKERLERGHFDQDEDFDYQRMPGKKIFLTTEGNIDSYVERILTEI